MGKKNILKIATKTLKKNQDITLVIILTGLVTGILTKEMMRSKIQDTHHDLVHRYDHDNMHHDDYSRNSCSRNSNCRKSKYRNKDVEHAHHIVDIIGKNF